MAISIKKYDSDIPDGSPSQDKTTRCPTDQFLRNRGFRIYARPDGVVPIWERDRRYYDQDEAVRIANKERDDALRAMSAPATVKPGESKYEPN